MKSYVAPSLLSADFLNLAQEIEMINQSDADYIHCDVMDGVFVPNISFGIPIVQAVNKIAKKPLDVHLMIINPDRYIQDFKNAGAAVLSVHIEACQHLHRCLETIHKAGMKAGIVLNPHTAINQLDDTVNEADMVLLMAVNPGFGGQKFIEHTLAKISRLKEMILQKNLSTLIEVDGGITVQNGKSIIEVGADILVAGSAIFNAENPSEIIKMLKF